MLLINSQYRLPYDWLNIQQKGDLEESLDIDGRTILERILDKPIVMRKWIVSVLGKDYVKTYVIAALSLRYNIS